MACMLVPFLYKKIEPFLFPLRFIENRKVKEFNNVPVYVVEISRKIDELLYEREITSMMKLAEKTLSGFFENEEDIYKITDLKVRY